MRATQGSSKVWSGVPVDDKEERIETEGAPQGSCSFVAAFLFQRGQEVLGLIAGWVRGILLSHHPRAADVVGSDRRHGEASGTPMGSVLATGGDHA